MTSYFYTSKTSSNDYIILVLNLAITFAITTFGRGSGFVGLVVELNRLVSARIHKLQRFFYQLIKVQKLFQDLFKCNNVIT